MQGTNCNPASLVGVPADHVDCMLQSPLSFLVVISPWLGEAREVKTALCKLGRADGATPASRSRQRVEDGVWVLWGSGLWGRDASAASWMRLGR